MRWARHVMCIGEMRNAYKLLIKRPEGKKSVGRQRCGWKDDIKIDLTEKDEGVD
jgi:hypothetical protein